MTWRRYLNELKLHEYDKNQYCHVNCLPDDKVAIFSSHMCSAQPARHSVYILQFNDVVKTAHTKTSKINELKSCMGEFECVVSTIVTAWKAWTFQNSDEHESRFQSKKYQFSVCILFRNFCESFSLVCAHLWLSFYCFMLEIFCCLFLSFSGLALGVNDTSTKKYWNDETLRGAERKNEERGMKFYDANEN